MRQILQRARVAAVGQERPRINTHGHGQGKEGRTVPYRLQREYGPANALIMGSGLQNAKEVNFCYFKLPNLVVMYYSHRKITPLQTWYLG